jgi:hypothetical protein
MSRDDLSPKIGEFHYSSVTKIILKSQNIEFYEIMYQDHCKFLFKLEQGFLLIHPNGSITKEQQVSKLGRKIISYERIMGKDMPSRVLDSFLHIDEVEYILTEFLDVEDELYQLNYPRLRSSLDHQIASRKQRPLDLFSITYHYEYIYDSLIINLGPPERTENYYHKLNRTINRLIENLDFISSDDDPIGVLIILLSNLLRSVESASRKIVAVGGYGEYLILQNYEASGVNGLIIPKDSLDLSRSDIVLNNFNKEQVKELIEESDPIIGTITG